jgi:hypothetical protein
MTVKLTKLTYTTDRSSWRSSQAKQPSSSRHRLQGAAGDDGIASTGPMVNKSRMRGAMCASTDRSREAAVLSTSARALLLCAVALATA